MTLKSAPTHQGTFHLPIRPDNSAPTYYPSNHQRLAHKLLLMPIQNDLTHS